MATSAQTDKAWPNSVTSVGNLATAAGGMLWAANTTVRSGATA